ncbi:hybrid sensor histidine kinase/response regulator [Marinilabilia sp.]
MKSETPEKYINRKVTIGFSLILILAALAFGINYGSVVSYLHANEKEDPLGDRLKTLNELLFRMQEANGSARLYSLTGRKKDLASYRKQNDSVLMTISRLQNFFPDSGYQSYIDTLRTLFNKKEEQTEQLFELSQINRYRRRYGEVLSILPDSINYQISQITYSSVHLDSVAETRSKPEHKSFFGRIASFLTGDKDKTPDSVKTPGISQVVDSSKITRIRKDPALEEVKHQLEEIKKQDKRFATLLSRREEALIQLGNKLTNTIRHIVKYLEERAILDSVNHQKELDNVKANLLNRLIFLGISALLIFLGFVLWIGRDLKKSQRLKEQLIQSHKKIESLMKVKERFLANMSHEIRTPLTSIIGFSELLKDEHQNGELIHNSAMHLLTLVNDILDLSTLEEGKLSLNKENISAKKLIEEIWLNFKQKADQKGIEFNYSVSDELKYFRGDKTRLRQVLFNLIGNALKFTSNGKVWINVKRRDNWLIFEIGDTGIGIPQEKSKTIFEEFSQLNPSPSDNQKGTGLGLAISKKLVEAMGGRIELSPNNQETGSIFTFTIPFEKMINSGNKSETSDEFNQAGRIMIVDDDPMIGQLIKGFLKNRASVEVSNSPVSALNKALSNHFDLIITDFRMPEMNGIEFINKIRKTLQTPVLLLSAATDEFKNLKEKKSVDHVYTLSKPFSKEDLLQIMRSMPDGSKEVKPDESILPKKNQSTSLYDLSEVLSFTGEDKSFLKDVIQSFIEDTEKNIKGLSILIKNKKHGEIAELAHKMLTGFRQFHIQNGVNILKGIEILGRKPGNTPELKRGLKRLKRLWRTVKNELNKEQ